MAAPRADLPVLTGHDGRDDCYAVGMDPDGATNWLIIAMCFTYAALGWAVLAGLHFHLRRRRRGPHTQRDVAAAYLKSWQSNSQSNFQTPGPAEQEPRARGAVRPANGNG